MVRTRKITGTKRCWSWNSKTRGFDGSGEAEDVRCEKKKMATNKELGTEYIGAFVGIERAMASLGAPFQNA